MKSVFHYTNYRQLIRDYHADKKLEQAGYSYQVFANSAGVGSKQALMGILSGKRPLPKASIFKTAQALKLSKKETEYFEALVHYNDAKKSEDKTRYYERMRKLAGKSVASHIGVDKYDYFSQWYHVVIRELVVMDDFNGNYEALAKRVSPRITKKQAEDSVKLLLELQLIEKIASNKFRQTSEQISTGDEISSLAIYNHQQATMSLAKDAYNKFSREERDISSLTLRIPKSSYPVFKKEIQLFRKNLLALSDENVNGDMVYQVNFQFFPVTEPNPKEPKK